MIKIRDIAKKLMLIKLIKPKRDPFNGHWLRKVQVDCDLSLCAFQDAVIVLEKYMNDSPQIILCSIADADFAQGISENYDLSVICMPADIFPINHWMVIGRQSGIWSPGAGILEKVDDKD